MRERVKETVGILFFISWFLCGCSVETFFTGGAPAVILFALVAVACALYLHKHRDGNGPTGSGNSHRGPE